MTTHHATFVIERNYAASPAQVFAAWADPKAKARWFVGPDAWEKSDHKLDFRVGGRESAGGGTRAREKSPVQCCFSPPRRAASPPARP